MKASGLRIWLLCLAMLIPALSQGHHSFAVFDFDTLKKFEGEVVSVKFRNPHIEMTLKHVDENGEEKIIDYIEGAPANMLVRNGIRPEMIKPGETITTYGSPLIKDSSKFFLRRIVLADGTEYGI